MTIASAIQSAQQKVANAYTAISNKGGTLPATQNLSNLPTAIGTITQTNLTTLSVTTNGTYTPSSPYNGFSQVDVSVNAVNNTALSITPTTSAQSFTVSAPYTGYNPISISAVTSAIDPNIQAKFIRNGIEILGVTGTYGEPLPPLTVSNSGSETWYLTTDGDLYGCGSNSCGQQGSGNTTNVKTFTKRASNVKKVITNNDGSSGYDGATWYITNDGELYGCGYNASGQQGSGDTTNVNTFTKRAENVKDVKCCVQSTWYITNDGDLYGCGSNSYGQQGSGDTTAVKTFTKRASNVKDFDCSTNCVIYLTNNGDLWRAGVINSYGSYESDCLFHQILSNIKFATCYMWNLWYIDNNDDLYGKGQNNYGQQGSGDTTNVNTFTKRAENVKEIKIGRFSTWYLTTDGDLYGCGYNINGQQGSGDTNNVLTFTKRASNVKYFTFGGNEVSSLHSRYDMTTWYVTNDDKLYGCGSNCYGQQGNGSSGTNAYITTFTLKATNVNNVYITPLAKSVTTWYVTNENELYGCGYNASGQQGSGNTTNVTTFTKRN